MNIRFGLYGRSIGESDLLASAYHHPGGQVLTGLSYAQSCLICILFQSVLGVFPFQNIYFSTWDDYSS